MNQQMKKKKKKKKINNQKIKILKKVIYLLFLNFILTLN